MPAEVTLLINLAILSVRMVLTEWLEGSWGPASLKGDVGLSFCSQGIHRSLLALAILWFPWVSLPTEDTENTASSLPWHSGQRGSRLSPPPCPLELSCLNSGSIWSLLLMLVSGPAWSLHMGRPWVLISLRRWYVSWWVREESLIGVWGGKQRFKK